MGLSIYALKLGDKIDCPWKPNDNHWGFECKGYVEKPLSCKDCALIFTSVNLQHGLPKQK